MFIESIYGVLKIKKKEEEEAAAKKIKRSPRVIYTSDSIDECKGH